MSAIQLPVSVVSSSASEGEKAQLLKAAEVIKQEYARQKAYPALLAIEAQQVEMMLSGLRAGGPYVLIFHPTFYRFRIHRGSLSL